MVMIIRSGVWWVGTRNEIFNKMSGASKVSFKREVIKQQSALMRQEDRMGI